MRTKNVTLKDVAKRAGVSAMTVSRALSGKSSLVTDDTAERCRAAARDLGYVPNLMARSLRGEQLKTIVMFAEFISSHHYLAELVDFVSRAIEARGYGVICCQSLGSFHQSLRQFHLGGAIVIAPPETFLSDPFGEGRIGPVSPPNTVLLHSAFEQDAFTEVSPDISDFCYQAASYLLQLGHEHIAYVGGPDDADEPTWFALRREGLMRALGERGLGAENLIRQPCANPDMGPTSLLQLVGRAPETTGVLCISDEIAISVVAAAQAQGFKVPRQLSVIGCNNIHLSKYVSPSLTTISIDVPRMVDQALDLLISNESKNGSSRPLKLKLPAALIVRDSTAPAPSIARPRPRRSRAG